MVEIEIPKPTVTADSTITQFCKRCDKLVQADLHLEWAGGLHIIDQSRCTECGAELWSWKYNPNTPHFVYKPKKPDPKQLTLF